MAAGSLRRAALETAAGAAAEVREVLRHHPYHLAIAAAACGLAAAPAPVEAVAVAAAASAVALAALRVPLAGFLVASLLLTGALAGGARLVAIDAPRAGLAPGTPVAGRAVVLDRPRPSPFGSSATIEVTSGPAAGAKVLARAARDLEWPRGIAPGATLEVAGSIRAPATRDDHEDGFDFAAHLRRRGIAGELQLRELAPTGSRRGGAAGAIDTMRLRAERALAAGADAEDAALIRGMVLGEDEAISTLVRDDFRRAGLAHLLAVSGQNVMLLGLLALPVLAAVGLGVRGRIVALLVLIAIYVPLAGAGPSLQRAAAMGAAGLVAMAASRPASRWYGLLLAAAVTLALNPRVVGDPGWQLSFAAVLGILCLGPALRRPLRFLPRPLGEGIAITVAATLATAPLLAHHFGAVSLAGLPANLLALPVVAPAMWIGMAHKSQT